MHTEDSLRHERYSSAVHSSHLTGFQPLKTARVEVDSTACIEVPYSIAGGRGGTLSQFKLWGIHMYPTTQRRGGHTLLRLSPRKISTSRIYAFVTDLKGGLAQEASRMLDIFGTNACKPYLGTSARKKGYHCIVLLNHEVPVSTCIFRVVPPNAALQSPNFFEVLFFTTSSSARRQGHGSVLTAVLKSLAWQVGAALVLSHVQCDGDAQAFWARSHFHKVDTREGRAAAPAGSVNFKGTVAMEVRVQHMPYVAEALHERQQHDEQHDDTCGVAARCWAVGHDVWVQSEYTKKVQQGGGEQRWTPGIITKLDKKGIHVTAVDAGKETTSLREDQQLRHYAETWSL